MLWVIGTQGTSCKALVALVTPGQAGAPQGAQLAQMLLSPCQKAGGEELRGAPRAHHHLWALTCKHQAPERTWVLLAPSPMAAPMGRG